MRTRYPDFLTYGADSGIYSLRNNENTRLFVSICVSSCTTALTTRITKKRHETFVNVHRTEVIHTGSGCMELKPIVTDAGTQYFWHHINCGPDKSRSKRMADKIRKGMEARK